MNSECLFQRFTCHQYDGQHDTGLTYFFVSTSSIHRLRGESDILYIGKTKASIRNRYLAETATKNTLGCDQNTNIRTTHVYSIICPKGPRCFYIKEMFLTIEGDDKNLFFEKLKIWDKRYFNELHKDDARVILPLEKYLLVMFADEHLEVPPLNNSF